MVLCAITHRYEEGTDLDVHFQELHADWESSGCTPSNALQLVHAIKQCFKQMLQVSCYSLSHSPPVLLLLVSADFLLYTHQQEVLMYWLLDHAMLECHCASPVINLGLIVIHEQLTYLRDSNTSRIPPVPSPPPCPPTSADLYPPPPLAYCNTS